MSAADRHDKIDGFHRTFYEELRFKQVTFLGVPLAKNPMDLWIYQEIVHETRPEAIVECGTFAGGSALYLAHLLDMIGAPPQSPVITIDIGRYASRAAHPRIDYRVGSSTDPAIVAGVHATVAGRRTLVILDSDHSAAHVAAELDAYAPLVPPGGYLIVEDTNVNGHPVLPGYGPGPHEAVDQFLRTPWGQEFSRDLDREKFLFTFNPGGYLRRRKV